MAKKFLTNLDLAKNQILNVAVHNSTGPIPNPVSGQIYFDTTDVRMYMFNGTTWVDMSGDIQDVLGGAGLSASTTNDVVTLDINVDNATIEINNDTVRVKDLGITTGKINDSAVTTIKLNANAVTFDKFQQIAPASVLGNPTASYADITTINLSNYIDENTTATNIPLVGAVRQYIATLVGGLGNLEGGWDASSGSFPVGSSPVAGTKPGDYWYVTIAGTVDSNPFNVGDVIIAKIAAASTSSAADWIKIEVNRDQATESVLGLVTLATQTEVNTGTNTTDAVTPATLAGRTATETRAGIAEIATQTETNTGTDDATIVTPLKLKTLLDNRTGGYAANVGDGAATSFALTHGLATRDVVVAIYDNSTYEEVITDVVLTSTSVVTVTFAVAPVSNAYRVVIKK